MPKKTKEQKIIANYRKKLKLLQQQTYIPPLETTKPKIVIQQINKPIVQENESIKKDELLKKFFFQDLTKSILLIALIVTLEIVLYFVRIK